MSYEHGAREWQTDYHFLTWFARAVCNGSQALERFLCLWMEERRCRFGPATFLACGRDQVYDFLVRCWGTDSSMGYGARFLPQSHWRKLPEEDQGKSFQEKGLLLIDNRQQAAHNR